MKGEPKINVTPKFINTAESAVNDSLLGLIITNPQLGILESTNTVVLRQPKSNKVHLICGGGSGHQPAHAGYLSDDCLSASVCGGVFASPSTKHIVKAIQYLGSPQGVLVIIKNYTGDIINFESAVQVCQFKGMKVRSLVVNDDIAFFDTDNERKEARGLCGTVLLYKMLGAASLMGYSLERLCELGQSIISRTFSLNVSLGACSLPGRQAGFEVAPDCYQLGLGIHGEKGKEVKQIGPCKLIIQTMLKHFQVAIPPKIDKKIVILLNNLGGCSELEMGILAKETCQVFTQYYCIERIVVGSLMTSLQMHGMSLTLFELKNIEEQLKLIDSPTSCRQWQSRTITKQPSIIKLAEENQKNVLTEQDAQSTPTTQIIKVVVAYLKNKITELNDLDREVGDGDTGQSLQRSLLYMSNRRILNRLDFKSRMNDCVTFLGEIIAEESAGSLGTILGIFMMAVGAKLRKIQQENDRVVWADAITFGIEAIKSIGRCSIGDRTILDVLVPISEILHKSSMVGKLLFAQLLDCCREECLRVSKLRAKKGRARYLNGKEVGHADPGCQLVKFVIESILISFV